MNDKPKRNSNPPTLDFVTTLTPSQCVKRLKETAFSTIAQQLSIRANEQEFVVERPGIRYSGRGTSTIQFHGRLSSDARGTRIMGWAKEINGSSGMIWLGYGIGLLLWGGLLSKVYRYAGLNAAIFIAFFGIILYAIIFTYQTVKMAQSDKAKRTLTEWVRQTLDTSQK
jgi:hypothetical protein